jgi:hypothetical protein
MGASRASASSPSGWAYSAVDADADTAQPRAVAEALRRGGSARPYSEPLSLPRVRFSQSPSCSPTSATDEPAHWMALPMRSA